MLLILEDNAERTARFLAVVERIDPVLPIRVWRDAHSFMREAGPLLAGAVAISLDHDLEPEPGADDPGDGYMVAQWLVEQPTIRPVVVHQQQRTRELDGRSVRPRRLAASESSNRRTAP